MADDLHTRLLSVLDARLERARGAAAIRWFNVGIAVEASESGQAAFTASETTVEYLRTNDPATEIRRVEALRRVVERHRPCGDCNGDGADYVHPMMCHACGEAGESCGLVRDLAEGEGIEP